MLPEHEHRFCVRHLHANWKAKGFKGKAFKDALWAAARAPNAAHFKAYMDVIKGINVEAFEYLDKIDPKLWSRHAFSTHSYSVILLNNTSKRKIYHDYDGNDTEVTNG